MFARCQEGWRRLAMLPHRAGWWAVVGLLWCGSLLTTPSVQGAGTSAGVPAPLAIEATVPDIDSLCDIQCQHRTLHEFAGYRAVVLVFLGADCPVSNLVIPQLMKLEAALRPKGVQVLGIYSHEHETVDLIAAHASDRDLPFPVFKDRGQKLANALGIVRVPTYCVLDEAWRLRYRGRFSDQYGVNVRRVRAQRYDLQEAIEEVLAGKSVTLSEAPADGCLLDRLQAELPAIPVTYHEDVAPILAERCQGCHRPQRVAPFSLTNYEEAVRWGANLREAVEERRMPPWQSDPRHGRFVNDRRLEDAERRTLVAWVAGGMLEGQAPKTPPSLPEDSAWSLSRCDAVVSAESEYDVPAEGVIPYWHVAASKSQTTEWAKMDRWVEEAEIRADHPEVIHHVMVFTVLPGYPGPPASVDATQVLAIWAPGEPSFRYPPGSAVRLPAGCKLVFQVHFNPNGQATRTGVSVGLRFAPGVPEWEVAMRTHENRGFRIAPGDPHSRCEFLFLVEQPEHTQLVGLFPHLHVRGKSFYFEAKYPNGKRERLLSVPRYDFNWQTLYWFQRCKELPVGTHVRAVAHWDNSRNNPHNPDPSAEVHYGYQTNDEMMVGGMMFKFRPPERNVLSRSPAPAAGDLGEEGPAGRKNVPPGPFQSDGAR